MPLSTYEHRAAKHPNEVAGRLLALMAKKRSNLCVSVDVTSKEAFLQIVDAVGPFVCLIKTHIDIVSDFDQDLVNQLQKLSAQHDFLIFEDRKFADIGNTVQMQYGAGIYHIASWAHIVNAHPIPGDGIVTGLSQVGLPLGRGLLLLAEMSSKGNLATGEYSMKAVEMARRHKDFVMGFIAMHRLQDRDTAANRSSNADEDFLILTPGVGLEEAGDAQGQVYRTPRQVIFESQCDVIIVGRGIYASAVAGNKVDSELIAVNSKRYQDAGWRAYLERIEG